jgi:hypothetical protein
MTKIATQMPESNAIEIINNKVFAFLVYEVLTDEGLVEVHRIYKHVSDDTSLSYDALQALVDSASEAYAIELEQE